MAFKENFEQFEQLLIANRANRKILEQVEAVDARLHSLIKKYSMTGPICHVGSKLHSGDDEGAAQLRKQFKHMSNYEYVGIDIEDGPNVDVVCDLTIPDFQQQRSDLVGRFGFIYCSALLEHVQNPFLAAANISSMLKPGGHIFFSGPWVWGYHQYPDDYWRLSFSGIKLVFPDIEWDDWFYTSTNQKLGLRIKSQSQVNERKIFQMLSPAISDEMMITDRTLPYLNIVAIGRRKSA